MSWYDTIFKHRRLLATWIYICFQASPIDPSVLSPSTHCTFSWEQELSESCSQPSFGSYSISFHSWKLVFHLPKTDQYLIGPKGLEGYTTKSWNLFSHQTTKSQTCVFLTITLIPFFRKITYINGITHMPKKYFRRNTQIINVVWHLVHMSIKPSLKYFTISNMIKKNCNPPEIVYHSTNSRLPLKSYKRR